jgi:hypothetical protein
MPIIAQLLPPPPTAPTDCPAAQGGCCGQKPPCDTSTLPVSSCRGLRVVTSPVSNSYGQPLLQRMRSIKLSQNQVADVVWEFSDENSRPIDMSDCTQALSASLGSLGPHDSDTGAAFKFVFRLREQLSDVCETRILPVEVLDAALGRVQIHFTSDDTATPGIYFGELSLEQADLADPVLHSNIFYVIIQRGLQATLAGAGGPPSLAEIRLFLRDNSGAENYLLDNVKFDDAEIAFAITRPIDYWNEVSPPLPVAATTSNFPFRYHWLMGTTAMLFRIAAEQYRANELSYSAAGVSVDDQNKEPNYQRAADAAWKEWTEFVRSKKISMNVAACYGEVSSPYSLLG